MTKSGFYARLKAFNSLKDMAIDTGYAVDPKNGLAAFKGFYSKNRLWCINESGQVMEIIICFILGMIKQYLEAVQKKGLDIKVSSELDENKVDYQVNNVLFQQKFDWDDLSLEFLQDGLQIYDIKVIGVPNSTKRADRDIIDVISDILSAVGFLSDEISDLVNNAAALDAGYEIWSDYCEGITPESDKKIKIKH